MDINISGLHVYGYIGVYEEEKIKGQDFYIDVNCKLEDMVSYDSDNLDRTVNYGGICNLIIDYIENVRCDLIETAAEEICCMILESYELVNIVTVTIHKPNAPVEAEFQDINVSCTKGWEKAYLSLGSNMGDKDANIDSAIKALKLQDKIRNVKVSSMYTTKPYGNENQEDFRNCALLLETFYTPLELLYICNDIEARGGRVREEHWGPRTIDVDILLYGKRIIESERLNIPHVDMHNRLFVLEPLCEIAPNAYHPSLDKTAKVLLEELNK